APRRVSRSRMPPSRSDSESNISNTFNSGFRRSGLPVRRRKRVNQTTLTPKGASRCRAIASGLSGPVGGLKFRLCCESGRKLGMGPVEVKDSGALEPACGCKDAYRSLHLRLRFTKKPGRPREEETMHVMR